MEIETEKTENFAEKKLKVLDFLESDKSNPPELDEGIVDLVIKINQLSFLYTHQSCNGHIKTLRDGRFSYDPGGLWFRINKDNNRSQEFLDKLKLLVNDSPEVVLFTPYGRYDPVIEDSYCVQFGQFENYLKLQDAYEAKKKGENFKIRLDKLIEDSRRR